MPTIDALAPATLPVTIGDHTLAPGQPTLVIAEIGVNHDGSLARAMELVTAAAVAGADAVKLQLFTAARLMNAASDFATYQRDRVADADPAAMLRRYELSADDVRTVVDEIRRRGMLPLATPFSPGDVAALGELGLPAVKIASPDLVNRPLLGCVAQLGVPVLASTGAATLAEVSRSVGWLRKWRTPFALLHCVSSYPVADDDAHLCWIGELAAKFGVPVGYSDHTTELLAGAFAVAAGATVVEKHLTYDRSAAGPDHSASFDPDQFGRYVKLVRRAAALCGSPGKHVLDGERDVRRVSRQSLVAARDIPAGQPVSPLDLTVQRPGTGIPAADVARAVGRRAAGRIARGTLLTWDMLAAA
jgi:N,N'-diacetyllegionaminate synthase